MTGTPSGPPAARRPLMALRTGYGFSLGFEEAEDGWAEQYLAACDRVIDQR